MKDVEQIHQSVFVNEVIKYLKPIDGDVFVDGTLGLGGHALSLLKNISPKGVFGWN